MSEELLKEIASTREKLKQIQLNIQKDKEEFTKKQQKNLITDNNLNKIINFKENTIKLNVGGSIYQIKKDCLLSKKGTLFEYFITSGEFDLKQEIFIDRDPRFFNIILDFLRGEEVNYDKEFKSKQEVWLFKREVEFYQLTEIIDYIEGRMKPIEIINFSFSGEYSHKGTVIGDNRQNDINNPDGLHGICTSSPGWIVFQLNETCLFEEIEIGGYRGNHDYWFPDNGAGAEILVSTDQLKWNFVGAIPQNFGDSNKTVKLSSSLANYIMFTCSSNIGIGYLRIIKKESIFDR